MYDIVIGRAQKAKNELGVKGAILIGKHYVKMGQTTSLSNKIFLDVLTSHVVFICGKRGSGKSYTMGVIAEGISDLPSEVKENISVILLDTMGIYWTMKYPNKKDEALLKEWGLESKGLSVQIYTPKGYFSTYREQHIPTDFPFALRPDELSASDWCMSFGIDLNSDAGVIIERLITDLAEAGKEYDIDEIIRNLDAFGSSAAVESAKNRFQAAKKWGLFDKEGTPIHDLVKGGQIAILDVSCYATMPGASNIRALVIGLVSQKLFLDRMVARKKEEYDMIRRETTLIRGR